MLFDAMFDSAGAESTPCPPDEDKEDSGNDSYDEDGYDSETDDESGAGSPDNVHNNNKNTTDDACHADISVASAAYSAIDESLVGDSAVGDRASVATTHVEDDDSYCFDEWDEDDTSICGSREVHRLAKLLTGTLLREEVRDKLRQEADGENSLVYL